jgi:hypothetical protein
MIDHFYITTNLHISTNGNKNFVHDVLGKACDVKSDRPNCIEMPPELCLNLGVPSSVIRSLYLVPSVMHRMASLMLATQLRQEIQECSNCPFIPATLVIFFP